MASELHEDWRRARKPVKLADVVNQYSESWNKFYGPGLGTPWNDTNDAGFKQMNAWFDKLLTKGVTDPREPRIKVVNHTPYDIANLAYDELPEAFKKENRESARVVYEAILEQLNQGKALDKAFIERASAKVHAEWLVRNGEWAEAGQKLPFELLTEAEAEKDRIMVHRGLTRVASVMANQSRIPLAKQYASLIAKRGIASAARVVGLALGGASLTAEIGLFGLTYAPATACSSMDDSYLNAQGNSCEPTPGVSEGVLKFLDLPEEQQAKFFQQSRTAEKYCKFYGELYDKTFGQQVQQVSCNGTSAVVKMFDSQIGQYTSNVHFDKSGRVQNVGSTYPGRAKNASLSHSFDSNGNDQLVSGWNLKNDEALVISRTVQANKLYAQSVATCCRAETSEQLKCLHDFNTNRSQRLIESSGSTQDAE